MIKFTSSTNYTGHNMLGPHFMTSLLWNTDYKKMESILKVLIRTSKKNDIPFDYDMLGIIEE